MAKATTKRGADRPVNTAAEVMKLRNSLIGLYRRHYQVDQRMRGTAYLLGADHPRVATLQAQLVAMKGKIIRQTERLHELTGE